MSTVRFALCLLLLASCSGGDGDGNGDMMGSVPGLDAGGDLDPDPDPAVSGLQAFCQHSEDCGGVYYDSVQDCMDASIDYWGECNRGALDTFGTCMLDTECDGWNPDAYNPASGDCSEEWSLVGEVCD